MGEYQDRLVGLAESLGLTDRERAAFVAGRYDEYAVDEAAVDTPAHPSTVDGDGFNQAVAAFQRIGMTEAEARTMAIGRDLTESDARSSWAGIAEPALPPVSDTQRHELVEAADQVATAARKRLRMDEGAAKRHAVKIVETELRREDIPAGERAARALGWLRSYAGILNDPTKGA